MIRTMIRTHFLGLLSTDKEDAHLCALSVLHHSAIMQRPNPSLRYIRCETTQHATIFKSALGRCFLQFLELRSKQKN